MASQPERIVKLEQDKNWHWVVLVAAIIGFCGWLGYDTLKLDKIDERLSHIEGQIGNPLAASIKGLESAPSSAVLAANLDLLSAKIKIAEATQAKVDQSNLYPLAETVGKVTKQHPDLPQAWRAVATLASYRTAGIQKTSRSLPDCDINVKTRLISREEIPATLLENSSIPLSLNGYLFRDCTLRMDRLPVGKLGHATLAEQYDKFPPGTPLTAGVAAYLINCDIILNNSGIAESEILIFAAYGCRFEYQVDNVPTPNTQKLLLASLEQTVPGQFSVDSRGK